MNIFQGKCLDLELKSMETLEITLPVTLRQRISMMPSTFSMFRHPMIIYCPSYTHFRGLYVAETAARDSKSREKVRLKTVLADPAMCTDLNMGYFVFERKMRVYYKTFLEWLKRTGS